MGQFNKDVSGYTLIELMTTLTTVSILAAFAAPAYSTFIEKRKITGGAEEIAAFMMLARSEAVKHNQQTTVSFVHASDTNWCIGMILGDTACDCTETTVGESNYCALKYSENDGSAVTETQLMSSGDYSGIKLTDATTGSGDAMVTYNPIRGILNEITDIPVFTIQSNNTAYELTVNVSATGTVKTCTNSSKLVTGFKTCSVPG